MAGLDFGRWETAIVNKTHYIAFMRDEVVWLREKKKKKERLTFIWEKMFHSSRVIWRAMDSSGMERRSEEASMSALTSARWSDWKVEEVRVVLRGSVEAEKFSVELGSNAERGW
jgi:hypothetical protein